MKRLLQVCLAMLACATAPAGAASEPADAAHRRAVEDARAGRIAPALETLRALAESAQARQDILGDYVVVLGWAGQHESALGLLGRIDRAAAPAYVLEGLAGSARRVKQATLAEALYREAGARAPERVEPRIGVALVLMDQGRLDEAAALAAALRLQHPKNADVLEAFAEVATARREYFDALEAWQAILAADPAHRRALRGKVFLLKVMGASALAIELAERHPGLIDAKEREALAADTTASRIRWGAIDAGSVRGAERFAMLDRALAESEAAAARAMDPAAPLTAIEPQLVLDRLYALSERFHMREAVALHDALQARKDLIPAYATAAAAAAHLYLEHPERASALYREALATDPTSLRTRLGLYYALAESEQHAEALALIEQVAASTPAYTDAWSTATIRENPDYARVMNDRGIAPLLANRPAEAERRLRELAGRAPFNMDIRTSFASSLRARGWPRGAEEELRWVLAAEPAHSGALGERAGALREMRDYESAATALSLAQATAPEDKRVMRAVRLAEVHEMRELVVNGVSGGSSGGPSGTRDYALEAWLYSSPLAYRYRAFAHFYDAHARFANGTGRRERAGVGLEYRSPLVVAAGELSHGIDGSRTGASASVAITPNDFWTLRGKLDTSANEIPLQAFLAGVNARRALAEATWRESESRAASLSFDHFGFSDGNRRDVAQARWTERVIAGPVYKLEVTAGLYASRNTLANAAYFNPVRDFSPSLEFANEWLQWRRYTRAFRHRVVVSVGSYKQQGFGSGPVAGARYEQEWNADDRLAVRYGVGRTVHPYDGVQTARNYGYLSLNWKF